MGLPPTLKPPLGSAQDTVSSPGSKSLLPLAYYHAIFCTSPNSKLLSAGEAHILVISLSLSIIGPIACHIVAPIQNLLMKWENE